MMASAGPYAYNVHLTPDNHASISSVNFLQARCSSWRPNSVKAPKARCLQWN